MFVSKYQSHNTLKDVFQIIVTWGWLGGAMALGKLPVPGRPADLDYSMARASALAVGAGGGCLHIFFSHLSVFIFLPLSLGDDPI